MRLLNNLKCSYKQKKFKCRNIDIKTEQARIEAFPEELRAMKARLASLEERILNTNQFIDLPNKEEIKYVHKNVDIENYSGCQLNPESCDEYYEKLFGESSLIQREIQKVEWKLKHLYKLIEDIEKIYESNENINEIGIYAERDKEGKIVIASMNFSKFDALNDDIDDINLSYGLPILRRSKLELIYSSRIRELEIPDFKSQKERIWHGSIMLRALLYFTPILNKRIDDQNVTIYLGMQSRYSSYDDFLTSTFSIKHIDHIKGMISQGGDLSYEDLFRFYLKNGFIKNGRLYREV